MSERFYINLPLCPGSISLDGSEAHHLARVCRLRAGSEVCLFNGDGREYPARITEVGRREILLEVVGVDEPEREIGFPLEVAASLPKGDRCQFLLEKLTELGVTTFVPLECERTMSHPREGKRDKLERYVIEASKQCGRNRLMHIDEPRKWDEYVPNKDGLSLLAHPYQAEKTPAIATIVKQRSAKGMLRLAVGPEGGFTDVEIASAQGHGWRTVELGPRLLRVETAAILLTAYALEWTKAASVG